jgi:hypothetical protein
VLDPEILLDEPDSGLTCARRCCASWIKEIHAENGGRYV